MTETLAILQIVTNATLTIVGICVAVASVIVAYRNNFGWKPIVLITRWQRSPYKTSGGGSIRLEVWNRQKYPVTVRQIFLEVEKVRIVGVPTSKWQHSDNTVWIDESTTIAATVFEEIEFEFICEPPGIEMPYTLTLNYYDPRVNRQRELQRKGKLA